MNDHELTIGQATREYFERRGIVIAIHCSRCVRASRLELKGMGKEQLVSMKVNYIGPTEGRSESISLHDDPWCYRWIGSPFPERPRQGITFGFIQDAAGDIWIDYYAHVCLRAGGLYDNGVRVELEVPKIVADKQPRWQIYCNGEEILNETISTAGQISRTISIKRVSQSLLTYIADLRRQQKIVITEIARVCDKYELNWYLICGGLIGLVRDQSMLPWDDDLDIAMTFADYQRFVSAIRSEWQDGRMALILPDQYGDSVFLDEMTRIVYMEECISGDPFERLGKKGRADIHHHMAVDLYILQDAYDNRIKHWLQTRSLQALYGLALGHREDRTSFGKQWEKKRKVIAAKILSRIGRCIPLSSIHRVYEAVMRRSTNAESQFCFQANGYHACIPMRFDKSWFGSGAKMTANGIDFCVPVRPERFLKKMYGNYKQPPFFFYRVPAHWRGPEEEFHSR